MSWAGSDEQKSSSPTAQQGKIRQKRAVKEFESMLVPLRAWVENSARLGAVP